VLLCVGLKGLGFYRMGLCVWEYTLGSLLMEWWHLHTRFLLSYGATVQCIRIYHTLDWRGVFFCFLLYCCGAGQGRAEGLVFLMSFFNPERLLLLF
jgi:hypothetical protein